MYNGHSVSLYLRAKNRELPSDYISQLFCDDQNRIWIGTSEGAAWIDSKRQMHRVIFQDTILNFNTKAIIQTSHLGIVILTNKGHFAFEEKKTQWKLIDAPTTLFPSLRIKAVQSFGIDQAIFAIDTTISLFDYRANKVVRQFSAPGVISICPLSDEELAVGKENGSVEIVSLISGKIIRTYHLNPAPGKRSSTIQAFEIRKGINGNLVIASGLNGLVTVTPAGVISRLIHDPVNPNSIISNSAYRIITGDHGEVVVGTSTSGVSIYNSQLVQAGFKGFFTDASGSYYDSYTGRMAETGSNIVWIGTYDRLIRWDKNSNTSSFFYYIIQKGDEQVRGDIRAICVDKTGKLWISIDKQGITYFSADEGFTRLSVDKAKSPSFGASDISELSLDRSGSDVGVYK